MTRVIGFNDQRVYARLLPIISAIESRLTDVEILAAANTPIITPVDTGDSPYSMQNNETLHVDMSPGAVEVILPSQNIYPAAIIRVGETNVLTVTAPLLHTVEGEASKTLDYDGSGIVLSCDSDLDWRRK